MRDFMDEPIVRRAALETLTGEITVMGVANGNAISNYIHMIADRLRQLPPAQPEIILCRECEYWIPGYITDQDDFIPPKCGKYQQMVGHSADDFCSLAKRRKDATD